MSSAGTDAGHTAPGAQAVCGDCGAPLDGPYCSRCGEQAIDRHSLTLSHFLKHNVLHELSHVDGKIFRTFRYLIFRPGFLSAEYFAGRRRRYVNPVRLLLTCLLVLALVGRTGSMTMSLGKLKLNLLPPGPPSAETIDETIAKLDVFGILKSLVEKKSRSKDLKSAAAVEKFNHELKTYATALSFCNVLLLSAFLAIVYRRRRSLYVEHLVFSLHLASFVLLFSILPTPLFWILVLLLKGSALKTAAAILAFLLLSVEMIYLYKALLRFYRPEIAQIIRGWTMAAWAARLGVMAIFIANSVVITLTYGAGAAIALWRI
ncbi:MAG TPA: DUF3667 domain-containing protein [Alphaproteobacteria bacterium]|nr:DUF3667 domain-containing protein [Alphaproteobacteria bacterium]